MHIILAKLTMYDIHSHILPAIDDGPPQMEYSVAMALASKNDGTKKMICTPHHKDVTENHSIPKLIQLLEKFKSCLKTEKVELDIGLGMENHINLDLPEALYNGTSLTINQTKYVLIELPFFGKPNYIEKILFDVQLKGYTPVLAHPERLELFQNNPTILDHLVGRGMVTQFTAGSILGLFGKKAKTLTEKYLKDGLVHTFASDTHTPSGPRSPILSTAFNEVAKIYGYDIAFAMFSTNPKSIIDGSSDTTQFTLNMPKPKTKLIWKFW